ncbi:MAG: acyl-CoA dehydrogenase family protein [Crocinitomicaceae bacterium]|jgi:alkylation response protein AidB-like acyl-CoA dehydrogenase|nr:acyl-CoA dehydrogenase family protein [Crocinitomicaceae bacterium]MDG1350600.1 acyl-CoA dehydrogenase family protein [Crocinitomicaceae bacterium]MDG2506141.1 acyl-CoA dehydrogenase family protein [Crocinitomicaceae bacterium]
MSDKQPIKGGEFIIRNTEPKDIFTPEEWTEEHKMIAGMCEDFIHQEIIPHLDRIDSLEEGLMPSLLKKAGDLGLLGLSVPEEYGGMGVDFKTTLLATEYLGLGFSFSVAYGAHTGIGTLPLLYYGNTEQKNKYVAKLASGEWAAAYCLTEPSSGSDANSGKTKADLSEDGSHYTINGQKMWITNGGFANLFTVFAKIEDDENLTAFLVEADSEGITLNPEEKKMGIKGSSTRQVFFNNVKVPVENMLSDRGNGFKIALNILNIGRIKLGAAVMGGAKGGIDESIKYALEREQFGRSISKYGAIRYKLAEQVIQTYAVESATYRAGQNIDDAIKGLMESGMDKAQATLKGIELFAPECAVIKVAGSECLDYVVDEAVQIYGGMGYSAESTVERAYRDSRINRIFEGTNEINRMLTVDMVLRRAMKGELDLMGPAMKVAGDLMSIPEIKEPSNTPLGDEENMLEGFKKVILMVAGSAVQKLMQTLAKEQEVLMNIADVAIWTYLAESVYLRVQKKIDSQGEAACEHDIAIAKTYFFDIADKIAKAAKDAILSFAEGDEARMMLMGLKRFTKTQAFNPKAARQTIAQKLIADKKYNF